MPTGKNDFSLGWVTQLNVECLNSSGTKDKITLSYEALQLKQL